MGLASVMLMLVILVISLVGGVLLILKSRQRGRGYPACGKCGYDVTGTLGTSSARCPECGSDFGAVGIAPPTSPRNKTALVAGIGLLLVPLTCVGGNALMLRASYSRMAQVRQATVAAQAQAATLAAQQSQLVNGPVDPALVASFRPKAAGMTQLEAADRASELLQEISQYVGNQTLTAENAAQLRAEYEAMNERAMTDEVPATEP